MRTCVQRLEHVSRVSLMGYGNTEIIINAAVIYDKNVVVEVIKMITEISCRREVLLKYLRYIHRVIPMSRDIREIRLYCFVKVIEIVGQ